MLAVKTLEDIVQKTDRECRGLQAEARGASRADRCRRGMFKVSTWAENRFKELL